MNWSGGGEISIKSLSFLIKCKLVVVLNLLLRCSKFKRTVNKQCVTHTVQT